MGPCKKEDKAAKEVNVTSLCSAAIAKFRNQRMSAYAHRISVILIHSGAKSQDFRRLNQLGICMSHGETKSNDSLLWLKGYFMLKISPLTDFHVHDRTWNLFARVLVEEQEVV